MAENTSSVRQLNRLRLRPSTWSYPDIPLVGLLSNIRVLSYIDTQLQLEAEAREVLPYVCAGLSFEQGCC